MKSNITFIDLFAGLGGFHLALSELGCRCVFASELRSDLQELYKTNFKGTRIEGDITKVNISDIPHHDILCAGFPCQPFSQAGKREGFSDDKGRGNMFNYICAIIEEKAKHNDKPSLLILENVANLKGHDDGRTWRIIQEKLKNLGYYIQGEVLSPHQYGYPQHRKRIYIVGIRNDIMEANPLKKFEFPIEHKEKNCDIHSIIDEKDTNIQPLTLRTHQQLKVWQEFLDHIMDKGEDIPSFPIWAMEFGADYKFEEAAPYTLKLGDLNGTRGSFGRYVEGISKAECLKQLPVYARTATSPIFPKWKIKYIQQNREFREQNKEWVDDWAKKIVNWENSHQKFEWNCRGNDDGKIKDKIVQYRASGIRVKLPTFSPALNLVGTQVPILPWIKLPEQCVKKYTAADLKTHGLTKEDVQFGRYLSIKEAAKLQGMEKLDFGSLSKTRIYEALGNAVNTQVVKKIAEKLITLYGTD